MTNNYKPWKLAIAPAYALALWAFNFFVTKQYFWAAVDAAALFLICAMTGYWLQRWRGGKIPSIWREGGRGGPQKRWVFLEKFEIPDPRDPARNHFTRYRIFQCPWFGWYAHHFEAPDERVFHDHPWHFISIIFNKGWYIEQIAGRRDNGGVMGGYPKRHGFGSINIKKAKTYHYVSRVSPGGVWSMLLVSKRVQDWGFGDVNGWTPHAKHEMAQRADEAMRLRREMKEMR
jgi:hypothetical protein